VPGGLRASVWTWVRSGLSRRICRITSTLPLSVFTDSSILFKCNQSDSAEWNPSRRAGGMPALPGASTAAWFAASRGEDAFATGRENLAQIAPWRYFAAIASIVLIRNRLLRARRLMYLPARAANEVCRSLVSQWRRLCPRRALYSIFFRYDRRDDQLATART